jgi:hypothetical protein
VAARNASGQIGKLLAQLLYRAVSGTVIKIVIFPGVEEMLCPGNAAASRDLTKKQYGVEGFILFPVGIAKNKNTDVALQTLAEFRKLGGVHSLVSRSKVAVQGTFASSKELS